MGIEGRILYEDNHLIVVNKLPSEIVQGDKTGDVCLLDDVKAYLKEKYNKPGNVFAGLVHRIDRPVSGAVVFAKTSKALSRMTVKVKDRDFHKVYLAIVQHRPPKEADLLEDYIVKNEKQNGFLIGPAPLDSHDFTIDCGGRLDLLLYAAVVQTVAYQLALCQGRDLMAPHDNRVMYSYFDTHNRNGTAKL